MSKLTFELNKFFSHSAENMSSEGIGEREKPPMAATG
jgi:hypothetical protein